MQNFKVLDEKLDLNQSYFLEASAGTGKTFSIEHFVVRQIVERGLSIEKILVVTFTNKATQELKTRLFENLQQIKKVLTSNEKTPFEYVKYYQKSEDRALFLKRLNHALLYFDQCQIFTIHAFCHDLLKKHFLYQLNLVEHSQDMQLMYDFFYVGIDHEHFFPSQILKVIQTFGFNEKNLLLEIARIESEHVSFSKLPNRKAVLKQLKENLKALFSNIEVEKLQKDIYALGSIYCKVLTKTGALDFKNEKRLESFLRLVKDNNWDEEAFCQLAYDGLIFDLFKEKKQRFKPIKLHYPHLLENVLKDIQPLLKFESEPKWILYRLAKSLRAFLKQNAKRQLFYHFDDLIETLLEKIQDPEEREKIQELFEYVVIDEFQDTDSVQFQIFYTLFIKEQKVPIFLVGDPKQSIYGFRKADVYAFFQAKELFCKENQFHLTTNFRSQPNLTQALNHFFSLAKDKTYLWLPKENKTLPFHFTEPKCKTTKKDPALHFMLIDQTDAHLFANIYRHMCDLLEKGYQFEDMAILVKDRNQQESIYQFLKSNRVPCQLQKEVVLKKSQVFWHIKAIVEAIQNPEDINIVKKLMMIIYVHQEKANSDAYLSHLIETLLRAKALLLKSGLMASVYYFLWHIDAISFLVHMENGKEIYLELVDALGYIAEKGIQEQCDPFLLLDFIDSVEEHRLSKKSAQKGVIITTIHKSKGLEYPIVFALGVMQRVIKQNKVPLQELEDLDAEKLRALYVTLTRAKEKVFVPLVLKESSKMTLGVASPIEVFIAHIQAKMENTTYQQALQHLDYAFFAKQLQTLPFTTLDPVVPVDIMPQKKEKIEIIPHIKPALKNTFEDLSLMSFSQLTSDLANVDKTHIEAIDLPKGPLVGTYLHDCLKICFLTKVYQNPNFKKIEAIANRQVPKSFLEEYGTHFCALIEKALLLPLDIEGKSIHLQEIPFTHIFAETEFLFIHQNNYFKGFIDLIFMYENNWYIVDWKSNILISYTQKEMQQEMQRHNYMLQASIYEKALDLQNKPVKKAFYVFLRDSKLVAFTPKPLEECL
ncbi:MAG: RecBCD enzyme subunit RecB [Chlamydiae bacterium]|nr:RecBCD enzyme subunit RecB [Chlamydiota bacterium]